MNGNVSREGIDADLAWMRRVGVGGVQNFDGSLETPQVVANRLPYMSEGWRDAFRHAVERARSEGLEFTIASSPGWSLTGGPSVRPEAAMKKLVWSEVDVEGGQPVGVRIPQPPSVTGPFQSIPGGGRDPSAVHEGPPLPVLYRDAALFAYRIPDAEHEAQATVTASGPIDAAALGDADLVQPVLLPIGREGAAWIQFDYGRPQTIRAATMALEPGHRIGPVPPGWPVGRIEASNDGRAFRTLASVPPRGSPQQTVAFPATTARYFRLVLEPGFARFPVAAFDRPYPPVEAHGVMELRFLNSARVNRFEDKAGWSSVPGLGGAPTPDVSADALVAPADVVSLSGRLRSDGSLDWTPPPGRWRILRLGWSLTGRLNAPASPEATGLEVDKLNRDHVAAYLQSYIGAYRSVVGDARIGPGGISHLLTDSYEALSANWTDDMLAEFARRRGYDPAPWLPVLTGRVVGSAQDSDRFLWDFRRTLSDLIAEEHYGEIARQVHAAGMGWYAESHEALRAFVGDGMEAKRSADVPMSAAWTFAERDRVLPDLLESASVAHLYGQNLVAAESFTAIAPAFGFAPGQLRPIANRMMANGVNRFVIHTSVHQPLDRPGPGLTLGPFGQWFTRNETWGEMAGPWMRYLARSSHLLQQGRFVADIVWFYGEDDNITAVYADEPPHVPPGHAFDFINADALRNLVTVRDGRIVSPGGASYRLLVLDPAARRMTLPTLQRIAALAGEGATIVGARPESSPSLADDQAEFDRIADRLWSDRAHVFRSIGDAAAQLGLENDADFGPASTLAYVHRRLDDADIYFVTNLGPDPVRTEASFRVSGKAPEAWNTDDGTIRELSYRREGRRTRVPVTLAAGDAVFIVFRDPDAAQSREVPEAQVTVLQAIEGPWRLLFPPGLGAPAEATFESLRSWSEHALPGIRYFSGVATYRSRFTVPPGMLVDSSRLMLDLGEVADVAEVFVNGRAMGIAWHSPFRVDVTDAAHAGENQLEVRVANTWRNRMIGDRQPGVGQTIAFSTFEPFRGDEPLTPSGLLGPVRLLRVTDGPVTRN